MKNKKYRIYIDGSDNIGWSIDSDRFLLERLVAQSGHKIVDSWVKADIIHNVWWNNSINTLKEFYNKRFFLKKKPKVIVTASNFVDKFIPKFDKNDELEFISNRADLWIAPGSKQKKIFDDYGFKNNILSFPINCDLFNPSKNTEKTKKSICYDFSIPFEVIQNKTVIGSFQRDSQGFDLNIPKWEKDPDLLIKVLKDQPKERFILLLAGPRRHYVIKKCKEYQIPYYYIGNETDKDDLLENAIDLDRMPQLYSLIDLYLITSKSEGGPKAAIESTAMKTFVMSTDVGLCSDYIDNNYIYNSDDEYIKGVADFIDNRIESKEVVEANFNRCMNFQSSHNRKSKLDEIYCQVMEE